MRTPLLLITLFIGYVALTLALAGQAGADSEQQKRKEMGQLIAAKLVDECVGKIHAAGIIAKDRPSITFSAYFDPADDRIHWNGPAGLVKVFNACVDEQSAAVIAAELKAEDEKQSQQEQGKRDFRENPLKDLAK